MKLCHMHWHWGCCHRAATAAALCHIRILYALASIQGSQPIQPASQPFRRPSVHPAVCLSIQTVSRCSCQRSILQFIIIVIDSFEWLQWQTGLPSVDRGRERERESTCPGCDCIAFDLFGPARFMRIRHGKLPETAKLVTDFNV